ncbi:TIM barrel protein [Nocardia sp. NPDC057668]|uniref:TIM barrel protein n=1 Tax=Nocardia sp. NPDC057668 TaxID=3346202 RepID=UPI003671C795
MTETLHPLRIAAAPISWGVCEVPGWGHVLDPATVLAAMAGLGVTATEFGPPDYLPGDPHALRGVLAAHGMTPVGGFLALPLHRDTGAALATARATAARFAAAGAEVLVLAAATGESGYDARTPLDGHQWRTLIDTAETIAGIAADHGLRTTVHPHVGTHIETAAEVARFLADTDLDLCLDTGHLSIGGTDPVELGRRHPGRVGHVHLKDVRADLADRVRAGELDYSAAVRAGLYVPLGDGDLDIAALIHAVHGAGYRGWYVIEQDTMLAPDATAAVPTDNAGRSLRHLAEIGSDLAASRI